MKTFEYLITVQVEDSIKVDERLTTLTEYRIKESLNIMQRTKGITPLVNSFTSFTIKKLQHEEYSGI